MRDNTNKAAILLADDEFSIRDIVSRRLARDGYKCTTVADGSSTLKKLNAHEYDMVLLDINMPKRSGTSVLKEIRGRYPDTAVIMITAIADVEIAIDSMKMGAYDYLIKPIDLDILMVSVNRALDERRLKLENKDYQLHLEEKVKKQTNKIRETFLNSITSLAYALEAKDGYTSGHSQRVTGISIAIAKGLGMPEDKIEKIKLAGLVHDIGKIGVKESVLNKPGKLTDEEYQHIMSHPEIGERILDPIVEDKEILEMVRHHHERYDGTGYPDGLSGEEISQGARILAVANAYANMSGNSGVNEKLSQGARILAVADAYDAMTSDRPYRQALSPQSACAEMEREKGRQFDPLVVDVFLKIMHRTSHKPGKHAIISASTIG